MKSRSTTVRLGAAICLLGACTVLAQIVPTPELSELGNRFARVTISEHSETRRYVRGFY